LARLGVWYPIDRLDAGGIRRLLRTVEDLGYSSFWYPEALGAGQAAGRRAEGLPRDGPRYGARPRSAGVASLYDLNKLPQQLAANRFHRSRPRRWRFGQVHRCDGALGRCQDDCSRPESAFGCGSDSSLHSAGPPGGRYRSARSNLDRAQVLLLIDLCPSDWAAQSMLAVVSIRSGIGFCAEAGASHNV
jgi:hypothetical protein